MTCDKWKPTYDILSCKTDFWMSFYKMNHCIEGQLISKAKFQVVNSSKKRTNKFNFTTMRRVFVRFLEEIEDTKKTFRT